MHKQAERVKQRFGKRLRQLRLAAGLSQEALAGEGIEIKGSRYMRGWQGHNPEDTWLMAFVFDSGRPADQGKGIAPKPFKFVAVVGARLTKKDWLFAGRSETSRRTITASVTRTGYDKMMANWIYKAPLSGNEEA